MAYRISLCIVLFVMAVPLLGQDHNRNIKVLDTDNGLSQNTVKALFQDDQGFVWAATGNGLNRYDGHEFVIYRNTPGDSTSLSNNDVNHLDQDGEGNIWMATEGGGVNKFDPRTETFTRFARIHRTGYGPATGRAWTATIPRPMFLKGYWDQVKVTRNIFIYTKMVFIP